MKLPRATLVGNQDNGAIQGMYLMRDNLREKEWAQTSLTKAKDQTLAEVHYNSKRGREVDFWKVKGNERG